MIPIVKLTEPDELGGVMTSSYTITIQSAVTLLAFKELISRGANTWDSAPPEIKEFVDNLIHGAPLQNYYSQTAHKPIRADESKLKAAAQDSVGELPTSIEELSICDHCFQRGHAHRFNCPALAKK